MNGLGIALLVLVFIVLAGAGGWFITGGPGRRQRATTGTINRGGPATVAVVSGLMVIAIATGIYLLASGK
ncbi:hypothetical protein ABH923_000316 [Leifsonia sp. EB41]|uniref:hypothetical protein n=1 Tax=Leifsonia sp. EB41 TaxID=3156260 RepID=UPI0035167316